MTAVIDCPYCSGQSCMVLSVSSMMFVCQRCGKTIDCRGQGGFGGLWLGVYGVSGVSVFIV